VCFLSMEARQPFISGGRNQKEEDDDSSNVGGLVTSRLGTSQEETRPYSLLGLLLLLKDVVMETRSVHGGMHNTTSNG
jgi:hypothetical protein